MTGDGDVVAEFLAELRASYAALTDSMAGGLHKCLQRDCARLVSPASAFCCGPCATADDDDATPGRDRMHTGPCEERARERGPHHDGGGPDVQQA